MHALDESWKENAKESKVNQTYVTFNKIIRLICAARVCVCDRERENKNERKIEQLSSVHTTPISTPYNNNKNQKKIN